MTYLGAKDLAETAAVHAEQARHEARTESERHLAEAIGALARAVAELSATHHRTSD
ncbi:hypothetical protein ACQQCC_06450 [Janibacter sp. G1551]